MRRRIAVLLAAAVALLAAGGAHAASSTTTAPPPIKHVFVIVLENENADSTFGPGTQIPYLADTLRSQGLFVPEYYAIGHLSLDNYIAMVSGQSPNPVTQSDAMFYQDFFPPNVFGSDGQAIGQGAVYPSSVKTIADQLEAKGLTWKGYMEDMGNDPSRESKTCGHPPLNSHDNTQTATANDQYAARHNPFVYFHSIIDNKPRCDAHDVPLSQLPADLAHSGTTPNYVFITPNLCHDGHDSPCADGEPGGMTSANKFLSDWIPVIFNANSFEDGSLVIVTFDEAENSDTSSCCGEPRGPNTPNNGGPEPGNGGGRTGAVLISQYIHRGTVTPGQYNHYAMLRSVEDVFGLDHLGYAARPDLNTFGFDVFNAPRGRAEGGGPDLSLFQLKPPRVKLRKVPRRCVKRRFRPEVEATGTGIQRIDLYVGKHPVGGKPLTSFRAKVKVRRFRRGRHALRAVATNNRGQHATAIRHFRRCK